MQIHSLSSLNPLRGGAAAPASPYVAPPSVLAMDTAEIGQPQAEGLSVYQAMSQAVSTGFVTSRDTFAELGRAAFPGDGPPPAVVAGRGDEAFVTAGASLYRMQADGTLTEIAKEKAGPLSPPAVDGEGNVYFRSRTGEVVAVGAEGQEMWRTSTNGRSLQAHQERVGFFPEGGLWTIQLEGSNEVVHGLSKAGKLEWSFKLDPAERLVGVGPGGTLFTEKHEDGGNRVLQSIQPGRMLRKRRWKAEGLSSKLPTAWVSPQGQPIVLKKDGTLAALDGEGKERWTYKGKVEAVLLSPDGAVYTQEDQKRTLTRVGEDGVVQRQEKFREHVVEAAVGPDGTAYLINTDSKILAIKPDGSRTEAAYPFTDTSRLEVSGTGAVFSGTRRSNLGGMKQVTNEVVAFRLREPKAAEPAAAEPKAPEPVPTPQDGWIVIGDISLPVRQ